MLPIMIGINGLALTQLEQAYIRQLQPAGFVLFARNVESMAQLRALTDHLRSLTNHHPIIAIDQEGGRVVRTAALGLNLPSASAVAASGDRDGVVQLAEITAWSLRLLGVNLNFAPVMDICYDPAVPNALPSRCWGDEAQQVISFTGMYSSNLVHHGVLSCGKHFPGMGRAANDPHFDLPTICQSIDEFLASDMLPFMALGNSLPSLMVAHLMLTSIDDKLPSSLSPHVVRKLLRDRLDYRGVVFTDDLCMGAIMKRFSLDEAVVLSLQAGCDLPLVCHDAGEYLPAIAERLSHTTLLDALESEIRIERLISQLSHPLNDAKLWDDCLQKAESLMRKYPEPTFSTASSPVQRY